MTPGRLRLHLLICAFNGTAKHLEKVHGLAPGDIDYGDPHGLAHDHAVLHGAAVTADGSVRFPAAVSS